MTYPDLIWQIHGCPKPEREFLFHPTRKWRFDYAWPAQMIAVEIEGGVWVHGAHVRGGHFLSDMEKYNEAARLKWRVFRFIPAQLRKGQAQAFMKGVFNELSGDEPGRT